MAQRSGSVPIDKSRILDVRPLRCLVPRFPNPPGVSSVPDPQATTPFTCVPPSGPFPSGVQPYYPFPVPNDTRNVPNAAQNLNTPPPTVPLDPFRTPVTQANGSGSVSGAGKRGKSEKVRSEKVTTTARKTKKRQAGEDSANRTPLNVDLLVNIYFASFNLREFDDARRANGDKDTVAVILLVFDLLRRKLTLLEEINNSPTLNRPDLKASKLLMTKGFRTNSNKIIGHVPGIEIGDIFFFRMELCLVGVHSQSMGGIDYMAARKVSAEEEPVAVSIVSAGGYDDDENDSNVLIFTGQGGVQRKDKQVFDQKLERGNLALERSMRRASYVRVIRGVKDIRVVGGKIYIYDGLYKIQESWAEANKSGCSVFKYRFVRTAGQPEAFSLWKLIEQWKEGTATRPGVILSDLTFGAESQPVALVNEVDRETGPAHFTYISTLKYSRPFFLPKPSVGCHCLKECEPGDTNCSCNQRNDNSPPYSPIGVLLSTNPVIYECGLGCKCPPSCRSRISQVGMKFRLEVFKTKFKGWGLRSWDPIRAGGFICEYAGEAFTSNDFGVTNDNNYVFDATRHYESFGTVVGDSRKAPFPLVISAKTSGNVARFMNHSCSPNVLWKPVLRENNNESYLHVAFFAIKHIPPMQELTFDYGLVSTEKQDRGRRRCFCESVKCKGYFY